MGSWPLVGRAHQLRYLDEAASDARSVVVLGPAGCGKSRLVRDHAAARLDPVVSVRATAAASSIPLGAFASVLPDALPLDPLGRLRAAANHLAVTARP